MQAPAEYIGARTRQGSASEDVSRVVEQLNKEQERRAVEEDRKVVGAEILASANGR